MSQRGELVFINSAPFYLLIEDKMSRTEAQTRKELIDVKLHEAGWNVNDRTQVIEEFDIDLSRISVDNDIKPEPAKQKNGEQFPEVLPA